MKRKKNCIAVPSIFEIGFHIFDKWMKLKHEGKSLQKYFDDNKIRTVAIYGMGSLGQRLAEELDKLDVELKYAIDRNAANINLGELKVVVLSENIEKVDAIIVTPVQFFYSIENDLMFTETDIISIEDIVEYCV